MNTEDALDVVRRYVSPLHTHREALARVASVVDGTFAALADGLGDLVRDGGGISERAQELDRFVREKTALVAAYQLFKKSVDLVAANVEQAEQVERELSEVAASLSAAQKRSIAFANANQAFWVLATSIRIEAARLTRGAEQEGILHLVASMDRVYRGFKALVDVQFEGLAGICRLVEETRNRIADVRAASRDRVALSGAQVRALLSEFEVALDGVSRFCEGTAAENVTMRGCFNDIVVALQFQDIVRQKLEHVVVACERALETGQDGQLDVHLAFTHHLALVQQAQLAEASRELADAERAILENAARLLQSSGLALAATRELQAGVVGALSRSNAASTFVTALAELHRTTSVISAISRDVGEAIERGRVQVMEQGVEMRKFAVDLRYLALDARVHAGRLSSGRVLETLATETSRNADETREITELLAGDVGGILALLEQVGATLGGLLDLSNGDELALRGEALEVQASLAEMSTSTSASFAGTEGDFEALRGKIKSTVAGVRFGERVAATLDQTRESFAQLAEATEPWATGAGDDGRLAALLDGLRLGYVMQDQRTAHDLATSSPTRHAQPATSAAEPARGGAPSVATDPAGSDLGENVELF